MKEGNNIMNNQLQVFEHEILGSIRVVIKDGEPWFVGKDIAELLGYRNIKMAVNRKVDDEDKGVSVLDTPGGKQPITIINESGMYSLIMSSKLPSAKHFKRWVTSEVLPTIRKHGMYMTTQAAAEALADPRAFIERAFELAQETLRKNEETIRSLEDTISTQTLTINHQQLHIKHLTSKATKYDQTMSTEKTLTVTDVAQMVGMRGTDLYGILIQHGYLRKDNLKAYRLTKEAPEGVFKEVKTPFSNKSSQIRITAKGASVINDLVQNHR